MTKKIITFTFFLFIFFSIYFFMNYYVYNSIISGIRATGWINLMLAILMIIGSSFFILGQFLKRRYYVYWIGYIGHLWLGVLAIAITVLLLKDLLLLFANLNPKTATYGAMAFIFAVNLLALYNASKGPQVKEVEVAFSNLPEELSDFKIVQLSDIHLGMFTSKKWVEGLVDKVNRLNPDLVVITGDMVDDQLARVKDFVTIMRSIESLLGVYAVSGNHEFYTGIETFYNFTKEANIKVLKDEGQEIGEYIQLIGLQDKMLRKYDQTAPKLEEILKDCNPQKITILLSHQPIDFEKAVGKGVNLQLSGHTHQGQIPPMNFIVAMFYRYSYGLYKYRDAYIYTTSGTGTWGPPMRLFTSSEIVKLILKNK